MTTYRAKRERKMNTRHGHTVTMTDTRTFSTEMEAIEQVMAWEEEMEAKGWAIYKMGDTINMNILSDYDQYSFAKLYIESK